MLLSEEHRMVRESARKFAEKELGPWTKAVYWMPYRSWGVTGT